MGKSKIIIIIFLFTLALSVQAFAQEESPDMKFSISCGAAIPQGKFGTVYGDNAGYANTGLSLMVEAASNNISSILNINTSISLTLNSMNKNALEKQYEKAEINTGSYLTTWIMTGLGVESTSNHLGIFGTGQVGLTVINFPDITIETQGRRSTLETETQLAFAYSLSVGFILDRLKLSFKYYNADSKYKQSGNINSIKMSVTLLQVMVGVVL